MSYACAPILVGVASLVLEILTLFFFLQFSHDDMGKSLWENFFDFPMRMIFPYDIFHDNVCIITSWLQSIIAGLLFSVFTLETCLKALFVCIISDVD